MLILLFDIDGTLVRAGGAGKTAMEAALCEEFGVALSGREVPYSGRTDRAIGRDLLTAHDLDPSPANQDRLVDGYLRRLPGRLTAVGGEVCPGVRELLARFRGRADVRLGLLTGNVRRGAAVKLQHFGLWDTFPLGGGFGDDHEDRDDVARAAVRALAEHADFRPADVWVVGDTPLDVRCARAVGANVLAVATGWHPLHELTDADVALPDLADWSRLPPAWGL